MGVIRAEDERKPIKVEEITYADYVFDETDDEEEKDEEERVLEVQVASSTPSRRRKQKAIRAEKKNHHFLDMEYMVSGIKKESHIGSRKLRRLENARLMCALADPNDICNDFSDIVPETISAFALLFIDQSNMKVWNEFIEKDEEEQQAFLENIELDKRQNFVEKGGHCLGLPLGRDYKDRLPAKEKLDHDSRNHHPAYSGAACFSRLDVKFKKLFSRRRLPWAFMNDVENALRSFFLANGTPDAEWASAPLSSAWHRLILHGISQYLSLHSTSIVNGLVEKFVKVRNNRPYFIPPHKNLVTFLAQKRKMKKGNTWFDDDLS